MKHLCEADKLNLFYYKEKTRRLIIFLVLFSIFNLYIVPLKAFGTSRYLAYLNAKAYGFYANGNYDTSITLFRKAINLYPNYAPLYDGIADAYVKKGAFKQANYNYSKAAKSRSGKCFISNSCSGIIV